MNAFFKEAKDIYRLKIPFEDLYTSVFLIRCEGDLILVDTGAVSEDVDGYIVPALSSLGYSLSDVSTLVISHYHGDHAGGLSRILELAPDICVVRDEVREIAKGIFTCALPGHTPDCIGVLDTRSGTLISADGLQGDGVGRYLTNVSDKAAYQSSINKIREDKRIENILFSHAYEPWQEDLASGRESVLRCLYDCEMAVR